MGEQPASHGVFLHVFRSSFGQGPKMGYLPAWGFGVELRSPELYKITRTGITDNKNGGSTKSGNSLTTKDTDNFRKTSGPRS